MECNYWIYVNELGTQLLGFSWGPCQNLDIPCCIIILPIHQTCHFGVFPFDGKPHTKSNGVWQYISLDSKKCHEAHPPTNPQNARKNAGVLGGTPNKHGKSLGLYPNQILQQDPEAVAVARQLEARDRAGKICLEPKMGSLWLVDSGLKWWGEVLVTAPISICSVCLLWFCSNYFSISRWSTIQVFKIGWTFK